MRRHTVSNGATDPSLSRGPASSVNVTGPWQFPTCWTRRWSPSPTNSQPSGRLTAKATHGLPFAQFQRSAPRAGRHQMEIRDADGRGELKQVEDNILLSGDAYPLPARCPPVGAALKLGDRGVFRAGAAIPAQVSLHPRQFRVTTFPRAACPEPICRRTPAATTRPALYLTAHHQHPEDAPLEARKTAAGVGTFTWPKTGTANWPLTDRGLLAGLVTRIGTGC